MAAIMSGSLDIPGDDQLARALEAFGSFEAG
jgi:hypothetical protein